MKRFGHVLFEVDADQSDLSPRLGLLGLLNFLGKKKGIQRDAATGAKGVVILADLVILRHVRIEIVFAVEPSDRGDLATEHQSREDGFTDRLLVGNGKTSGETQADGAEVGVLGVPILVHAAAEHFGAGADLNVHLKANDRFPFGTGAHAGGNLWCQS